MDETKPWYLSKTVWASLVTIAAAGGSLLGLPLGGLDKPALTDLLIQAVTAVSGLIALIGRVSAEKRIS